MALTRKDKEKLSDSYKKSLDWVKTVVVLKQFWIPVNEINKVRIDMVKNWWKFNIIKKRVFLKDVKASWFKWWELADLEGSVSVLMNYQEWYSPLKVIAKYKKQWEKEKKQFWFEYLWWWFDNEWKDKSFVADMANMPSKEELLWKFVYLLNYPLQSFVVALDQIAKKK